MYYLSLLGLQKNLAQLQNWRQVRHFRSLPIYWIMQDACSCLRFIISKDTPDMRPVKMGPKRNFSMQILHKNWREQWNFANLNHFEARGSNDARSKPKILISWSLWVSIDLAWKDESIELYNESLALFSVAWTRLYTPLCRSVGPSICWWVGQSVGPSHFFNQFYSFKSFKSMSHSKSF